MPTPDSRGATRQQPAPALPTPVSAAIGLAAAYVQGVRRLPVTAVKVPVHAVGYALAVTDNLRREYEELAERGEALLARLRGGGLAQADHAARAVTSLVDDAGETLLETGREAAQGVRSGAGAGLRVTAGGVDAVADRVEDAAGQLAGAATGAAGAATDALGSAAATAGRAAEDATDAARDQARGEETAPEAEAPKAEPTPERPAGRPQRHDSAAESAVRDEVESVTEAIGGDRVPSKDELPIPNFDHLSLAQVRGRLRQLSVEELVLLRNYERAHADRLPIVTMLDNRISKVANDSTPGGSSAVEPGAGRTAGGSAGAATGRATAPGAPDSAVDGAAEAGATGWPAGAEGGAGAGTTTPGATGWPDTSGPGSAGGDGLASGGSAVAATTEAAPSVPAAADAAGDGR
jgi:hypothetical protein